MNYGPLIDHTILAPQATKEQVEQLCKEAMQYGFHSVCVNSSFVYYCTRPPMLNLGGGVKADE